ncbi:serine protease [Phenylobacterium sp.]|uniref:trypsin-like serine peptidase n=1 Tax=Phenylobacterium sp. TaxID=1871053 RepID=UPI0035AE6541
MAFDLSMELMHATVQLEQPLGDGTRTVGTGFLIEAPTPDGKPRVVLITANHVFERMPGPEARIGYRIANPDGSWTYAPQPLKIRDDKGGELWTHHPSRDVAAITITAPEAFAKAAIPEGWLADGDTFAKDGVGAGDEMMALGFPRGLAANQAGFPILRSGRVASYPVAPADIYPTFLLDFSVFPGNSGGPVFMTGQAWRHQVRAAGEAGADAAARTGAPAAGAPSEAPMVGPDGQPEFIAGLLTQQVELNSERLEIGIVTHAKFIRETIARLDDPNAPVTLARDETDPGTARAASATEALAPE